ncbi:MAG: PAS domain-containing protein, partial [Sphingobacteriales bacterium]
MDVRTDTYNDLQAELDELRRQLAEANDTIEAIRTGQIDALVVENGNGHELYTLKSADLGYRVFIERMTEGAVTLDKKGIILYCNSQFSSMVGTPISSVIGFPFHQYISPASAKSFAAIFTRCWNEDCKVELLLKGQSLEKPVLLSLTAIQIDRETTLSVIITDLTILKKNQQQLEAKNRELELANRALESSNQDLQQFASVASHDLQEPLRKIQMFSELLRSKGDENLSPEAAKYLGKIRSSAARMKNLVIDILNYSGLSSTSTRVDTLNPHEIIRDVLEDLDTNNDESAVTV